MTGRWQIPGTRWENVFEPEDPTDLYEDFVWCMGRATWYQQTRMGWPMERRTHYLAAAARQRRSVG